MFPQKACSFWGPCHVVSDSTGARTTDRLEDQGSALHPFCSACFPILLLPAKEIVKVNAISAEKGSQILGGKD